MFSKLWGWLRGQRDEWAISPCRSKMRRWEDGQWVYREMTQDERDEAEWWDAAR